MPDWEERRSDLGEITVLASAYHSKRQDFLDRCAKLDPVLSLIFGSTAFASALAGWPAVAAGAAVIVAGYSAINLSYGFATCSMKHEALRRRWLALRSELLALSAQDEQALVVLEIKAEGIEADSPHQMRLLSALGEDDERLARGEEPLLDVGRFWRFVANFVDLDWQRFRRAQ